MTVFLLLALLAGCSCVEPPRPNVLFIVWDTVRADHLSVYGYERPTTPRLETFAADAVVYENAISPGMWTLPAHASMFTGLPGTTHGAHARYRWLDHQHQTLAELLGADGYETVAFSSNIIASPFTNLLQGFGKVHTTYRRPRQKSPLPDKAAAATTAKLIQQDASTEISPSFRGNRSEAWKDAVTKDAAPVLHEGLMEFLRRRESEEVEGPWFAYINMMEAHTPRIPSMQSRRQVMSDEKLVRLGLRTDLSLFAELEYIVGKRDYTPRQLAAIRGVYDATLADLDRATGALLEDLEAQGILDDTLVILVSDHGEALGEHRMLEHRWSMYDHLLHVPLVVRYPHRFRPGRVADRVSTIDLFATVLDVARVEIPQVPGLASRSLVKRRYDDEVYAQMLDPWATQLEGMKKAHADLDLSPWMRTYAAVYEGSHKYIHASDGAHRLFDVFADPGEEHDLLGADGARGETLRQRLEAWEAARTPYPEAGRTERDRPRGATEGHTRALLEAMGYADPEAPDGDP